MLSTKPTLVGGGVILPNVSICEDTKDVHYNPYVEPIDPCASEKVKTTYEWVEIGGVKWATKNVGALTITDYGQKFSWGGVNGYTNEQVSGGCHAFNDSNYELYNGSDFTKYSIKDGKTVLEAENDAATVNMGSGWRMPTTAEFQALGSATTSVFTADYESSGVAGLVLTSKADSNKKLFFPTAGVCYQNNLLLIGSGCWHWSASVIEKYSYANAYNFTFDKNNNTVNWTGTCGRSYGCAVRGIYVG